MYNEAPRMKFAQSGTGSTVIRYSPADNEAAELADSLGFERQRTGFFDLDLDFAHRAAALWGFGDTHVRDYLQVAQTNLLHSYSEHPLPFVATPPHPPGVEYFPYQIAAAQVAARHRWTSLAHNVGIGKTAAALATVNEVKPHRILVVCPRFLVANWTRELKRWLVHRYQITEVTSPNVRIPRTTGITIVPMSRLTTVYRAMMNSPMWDFAIIDESHFFKNSADEWECSARAKALWGDEDIEGIATKCRQGVDLSATPFKNAPTEMYAKLHTTAPHVLRGRTFAQFRDQTVHMATGAYGDFAVSARQPEGLKMDLRATGHTIKPNLSTPPPIWDLVALNADGKTQAKLAEENKLYSAWKSGAGLARMGITELEGHLMTVRKDLGVAKVPDLVSFAANLMTQVDRLVIFAWHLEVCERVQEALKRRKIRTDIIYGKTPPKDKETALRNFAHTQVRGKRVIVAQISAAGVGINEMVAANHMIIGELPWTPADVKQIVGRLTRVTQEEEVFVHMLAFPGSVEEKILERIQQKAVLADEIFG